LIETSCFAQERHGPHDAVSEMIGGVSEGDKTTRWRYARSFRREQEDGDAEEVQRHLDEMADSGWELVSANAVQYLMIRTEPETSFPGPIPIVMSTAVMRHYFYWRMPVGDDAPSERRAAGRT